MLKAILVDNEPLALASLERSIQRFCPEVKILDKCTSAKDARKSIKKLTPDVIFLDIEMPYENGFELLDSIEKIDFEIIFITGHKEHALKAFEANATAYLLKPVDQEELVKVVNKLIGNKEYNNTLNIKKLIEDQLNLAYSRNIPVPVVRGIEFMNPSEIIYFEADGNASKVFLKDGTTKFVNESIGHLEQRLSTTQFPRIHHSTIINIDNVKKYMQGDGGFVVMTNGEDLSVARSRKAAFLELIYKNRP